MRLNTKLPYSSPECDYSMSLFYGSVICAGPSAGRGIK